MPPPTPAGPTPLRALRATQRRACLAQGGQYWAPIKGQHSMPIDNMPSFRDEFSDADLTELTQYLRARFAPDLPAWR